MAGIKGLEVRKVNARNHHDRIGYTSPWNIECSEVDVEALRIKLQIEVIRQRGMTSEERAYLRQKRHEIVKRTYLYDKRMKVA